MTSCNDDVDDDLLNLNLLICPHTHGSSTPLPSLMLITARADPPHTCVPSCVPIFTKPPIHHQILQLVPNIHAYPYLYPGSSANASLTWCQGVTVPLHIQSRVLQIRVRRGACAQWQSQCPLELEGCGLEICQFGILLAPPRRPFPHTPPQT